MAVPPATALHMGYSCMIPACQHYPAMLLPLALSHLESSACISAEGSVSHSVCGSQTVSLQKERKGKAAGGVQKLAGHTRGTLFISRAHAPRAHSWAHAVAACWGRGGCRVGPLAAA